MGKIWTNEEINAAWEKALKVSGVDASEFRKDSCGAWIRKSLFGKRFEACSMGWGIITITESNELLAMQWENLQSRAENFPVWSCRVSSFLNENQYLFIREIA